ncbi:DUF998 domain-containing protein [Micromonospora sp. MS34]|uniref:DUF998 domain-containing protein n=1 Tax=Micromonospora sp. MS34 TaxID=3385971 RepID=UPI0039A1863F
MSVNVASGGALSLRREPGGRSGPGAAATARRRIAAGVLAGLCLSAAALAAAPSLMPTSYSWVAQTTSESAAQGVDGAWLARLGFLLFGLSVTALAFVAAGRWGRWSAALHYGFGAFMAAAAAFSTRPWTGAGYNPTEDALHSVSATAVGVAFAAGVVTAAIHRRARRPGGQTALDIVAVAASVVVPLGMSALPDVDGALQRTMFAVAYGWYALAALAILRDGSVVLGTGRQLADQGARDTPGQ